jgi:hypothetical protein
MSILQNIAEHAIIFLQFFFWVFSIWIEAALNTAAASHKRTKRQPATEETNKAPDLL